MKKLKKFPRIKLSVEDILEKATTLGFISIDSENFKLHYIVDDKSSNIIIVTRSNGYVVLKKEQAKIMVNDLIEILGECF